MFLNDRVSPQDIIAIAEKEGISPLRVAIRANGYRDSVSFWPKPKDIDVNADKYPTISIANDYDIVGKRYQVESGRALGGVAGYIFDRDGCRWTLYREEVGFSVSDGTTFEAKYL